jgi:Fe2+ or Zn2+ uptake regulation protein
MKDPIYHVTRQFVCRSCRGTIELEAAAGWLDCALPAPAKADWGLGSAHVTLRGLCQDCQRSG